MKVKVALDNYLSHKGINYPPGSEVDVTDDEAIMYEEQGLAEMVVPQTDENEVKENDD